ncbi:MAG: type II toxin-antitoxin system VapC family toxin [Treponema sp.]|nr:type II toxin-antitoxin system VapC family toxin [Treponema sp.]
MEILADTHILYWLFNDDPKLSEKAKKYLTDPNNKIYYSVLSMWEIAIKHNIGKMNFSGTEFLHYCEQAGFIKLPFDDRHIVALETLDKKENTPPHNDPFDKALLAQAKGDCLMLLTHDNKFTYYDEPYYAIV